MIKKIIGYFIKNSLFANLLTIFVVIVGLLSILNVRRAAYRSVDFKEVHIYTEYPGASPKDVEINVTKPIEDKIKELTGIENYISSSVENFSSIKIKIDLEVNDYEKVKSDIRRAVDNVTNLPLSCKQPEVVEIKENEVHSPMTIVVSGDNLTKKELVEQTKVLKKKLLILPEVLRVDVPDMKDREIQIKLDLDKMNKFYISMDEVIAAIQNKNIEVTGGTLESFISEKTIITMSKFQDIHDVGDVIVRSNYDGNIIYLRDIAVMEDTFEKASAITRYNGKNGFAVEVYRKEKADIIKLSNKVTALVKEYNENKTNQNLSVEIIEDDSDITRNLLNIVYNNAIIGFILVLIILFIFMNFKNAFWSAMGIPFAVCFSFIFFPLLNITINSISLMGLVIMLGIIVDDAIIISETIYSKQLDKNNGINDIIKSISNIAPSVITAVITTIVAFLPILFWKSLEADFAREIPVVVIFILAGSLLEALFILPNHVIHKFTKPVKLLLGFIMGGLLSFLIIKKFLTFITNDIITVIFSILTGTGSAVLFMSLYKDQESNTKEKLFMKILKKGYESVIRFILRFRYAFVIIFISASVTIILILGITGNIKFDMFPDNDVLEFSITGKVKDYKSLNYTSKKVNEIENFLLDNYFGNSINSLGIKCGKQGYPEAFDISVTMLPKIDKCRYKADEIISRVRKKMEQAGCFTDIVIDKNIGNPNEGRDVEIQVIDNDDIRRKKITDEIIIYLNKLDKDVTAKNKKYKKTVFDIERSDNNKKDELVIKPKYLKNSKYGVTPLKIANAVRIAYDGYIVSDFITNEETINYRLILDEHYRRELKSFDKLMVLNNYHKLVRINDLIDIKEDKSDSSITHYNGDKTILISADLNEKIITPQELYANFNNDFKNIEYKYPGCRIILGGMAETSNKSLNGLLVALIIAVICVFFILILLFKSVFQPFIVMIAIPFGIVGVTVAFFFHGMTFSVFAILGIIGLSGVVVNNSLVMVDCINRLIKENPDKNILEIVIMGAGSRFRPILITTLTTVVGLLPTAYGIGGKNRMIIPVAMSMTWGLIFSTILTLLLIPSLYLILNDIKRVNLKLFNRIPNNLKN